MGEPKVNITLSADANVVRRAREYANQHHTTLNQLVRDHLGQLTSGMTPDEAAAAFIEVARQQAGRSPDGYRFDRDEIHERKG
jgi:hypothetical protein